MRIGLVINQLAPGGAEVQAAMLARHLRAAGHDVSVVSLLPPAGLADELEKGGVPVCAIDLRSKPLSVGRLIAFWKRQQPEIAHAHLFHANVVTRLMRLVCPFAAVISTIHSVAESGRDSRDVKARDLAYRLTDPLADATVCVSRAVAERHMRDHAVSPRRLRVIPNGVDTGRFRPDPEARRRMRATLDVGEDFTWVAAGRLMWKKNYPLMLRAMAECGRGTLLIAGSGPEDQELKAAAGRLGANARFLGAWVEMPALLNAADGFLLTSDVEGLPMALLEAAASGVPAVATDVGGVAEIVADGITGHIIAPGDASGFAAAMARLADAPPEARARMGEAARARVVERFEIGVVVRRWVELYKELLEH